MKVSRRMCVLSELNWDVVDELMEGKRKSSGVAYLLFALLGVLGAHCFYVRSYKRGVLYWGILALYGATKIAEVPFYAFLMFIALVILWLVDLIMLVHDVDRLNFLIERDVLNDLIGDTDTVKG